ncbi:class I SAM-dependent methyltransferase [Massilibacteroides sp.]|uniref:class I SAM-dependent methyltransferase n=1 Tax=Massilibacteroides sp. TaxID=2034766 RepID=UPI002639EEA8|nr:class I SAM-dependent methyltransferase [Massilibacteroides sp.]MDD4515493.1 class I SAM-dependent methyltransferase [Massilibacteroides sp.]
MKLTPELIDFMEEHGQTEPSRLLLNASRFPDVDIPFVVEQITARRQIRDKLPGWYANKALVFPSKLAAEQCSSEQTAGYKQQLVNAEDHVCDLTGGLGIDSYYFSLKAKKVTYIERFANYAEAACSNFETLQADNITVLNGNGEELATGIKDVDVFFIDPARRGDGNKRVFALSDCEPDLTSLYPILLERAPKIIAKISPMADILHTLTLLPETTEVHVISVRNECKELLFVVERKQEEPLPVHIVCVNFPTKGESERFTFSMEEERSTTPIFTETAGRYLYEPNASLLKAGAFKIITANYPVKKLHINSHLYTSDVLVPDFPGRTFSVEEVIPFSSALCKKIVKEVPQANITIRNFPLTVEALRKKTKIKDGGEIYLFVTALADDSKVLIKTKKYNPLVEI